MQFVSKKQLVHGFQTPTHSSLNAIAVSKTHILKTSMADVCVKCCSCWKSRKGEGLNLPILTGKTGENTEVRANTCKPSPGKRTQQPRCFNSAGVQAWRRSSHLGVTQHSIPSAEIVPGNFLLHLGRLTRKHLLTQEPAILTFFTYAPCHAYFQARSYSDVDKNSTIGDSLQIERLGR